jgi:hypothetical protein
MFGQWHIKKNFSKEEKKKILAIDDYWRARKKCSRYTLWNAFISRDDIEKWREMQNNADLIDTQHAEGAINEPSAVCVLSKCP